MWIVIIILLFLFALIWLAYKHHYAIFILLLIAPYLCYQVTLYFWYAKFIPEQIEISYPVSVGEEFVLLRGGCAVAIYKVSDRTLDNIRQNGLKFFKQAVDARAPIEHYNGSELKRYQAWSATPLPPSWTSEGSWTMCDVANSAVESEIIRETKKAGAYYTVSTENETQLVLVPSLGYVMYSYYH
ncbi:MAG TPA: hypothetical protein VIU46_03270 [Gallionellaceae bacterium]